MSEPVSKWLTGRTLVLVVVAAAGIAAWVLSAALTGRDAGVELEPDQWSLIEQGDSSVTIRFDEGGGCHRFKEAQVNESEVDVKVTMVVWYFVPGEGEACTEELKSRPVDVELSGDLGERQLRVFRRELRVTR